MKTTITFLGLGSLLILCSLGFSFFAAQAGKVLPFPITLFLISGTICGIFMIIAAYYNHTEPQSPYHTG